MSFTDLLIVCIIRLSLCPSLSDHYSATLINQKNKLLVEDQEQYPGVREPYGNEDMWKIINDNKYSKHHKRESEWNSR